ncbi:MAG: hypothetical protein QXU18_06275 [Thermoplasmatales archaeon]
MIEPTTNNDKKKQIIFFLNDFIKILEKYKDLDINELKEVIKSLSKPTHTAPTSRRHTPPIPPSQQVLDRIYSMSREELIKYLDNREVFPTKAHIEGLAKALHIRNTSRLSENEIKRKIVLVVYDKPKELREMSESVS